MIVGYGCVSTDGQSLESQEASLEAAGAERIFAEKISGAITDRKALAKAIAILGPGDVLLVTRLDRLARSTRDLLNALDTISKAGAKFKSLAYAWAGDQNWRLAYDRFLTRNMGVHAAIHGFRSSFRDWAGNTGPATR
jgi:DNA invertase Pin-like site-specific DNA recombinase